MSHAVCPNCKVDMKEEVEPDVKIDKCPKCGGIFLNKNELNVLTIGMAGDIEYCSIDDGYHKDNYPLRICPKCGDQTMKKINLLHFTDIIFDYCSKCGGFFLDKGELRDVNAKLQEIHGSKFSQEHRDYKNGHLVRIDILNGVSIIPIVASAVVPVAARHLQITVYFVNPLNIDLKVFDERWLSKIARLFKVHKGHDINIGNADFDNKFIIQGNDEEKIRSIFTSDVQQVILNFVSKKAKLYSEVGRIKIFDNRIVYSEGPYFEDINVDQDRAFKVIINELIDIADKMK